MAKHNFEGKTVLITGSSRGIGRAAAIQFAEAGAQVAIHYHQNKTAATEVLALLSGNNHTILQANLGDPLNARSLVKQVVEHFGKIDILVNNAGIFLPHPLDKMSFEEWFETWNKTINTNLNAAAVAAYTSVEYMRKNSGGKIINVGSRGAFRGEGNQPGYGVSKAGVHALSQSLAQALGQYGITAHALAPGFVETAMARPWLQGAAGEAVKAQSPLNRVATVQDVANAILFLASPEAEFTTGCILDVNGASYLRT